jgi:hypothetical protein
MWGSWGLVVAPSLAVSAATGLIFTVMNTSETLPDGVWFRSEPHTADAIRITGFGVYKNERVQLQCYAWGDAVGPYSDRLWYYANNVTRPTVAGRVNVGYLNAHYINDGKYANVVDAWGAGVWRGTSDQSDVHQRCQRRLPAEQSAYLGYRLHGAGLHSGPALDSDAADLLGCRVQR